MDIDIIMEMLDWNQPIDIQEKGIELGSLIQSINVFVQPKNQNLNKNVWENCAKILSRKDDKTLRPYLTDCFEWISDMNWPGSEIIYKRLKKYRRDRVFAQTLNECIYQAKRNNQLNWLDTLNELSDSPITYNYNKQNENILFAWLEAERPNGITKVIPQVTKLETLVNDTINSYMSGGLLNDRQKEEMRSIVQMCSKTLSQKEDKMNTEMIIYCELCVLCGRILSE